MDLTVLTTRAMERMFSVGGSSVQLVVDGAAPMRALVSEVTTILNAMRGKLDNKRRWHVAILVSEIPSGKTVKPGVTVGIASYTTGRVEEDDFQNDSGVMTFYVS